MSVDYLLHTLLALWSVILGAFFGLVYEFFRLLHRFHPRATLLICVEDLLFALICAVGMMLLFFNLSFGRMRFYAFPGVVLGFVIWYYTLGRLFRRVCACISRRLSPPLLYFKRVTRTEVQSVIIYRLARKGFGVGRFVKRRSENVTPKNESGG